MTKVSIIKGLEILSAPYKGLGMDDKLDNTLTDNYTPEKAIISSVIIGREYAERSCEKLIADKVSQLRWKVSKFDGSADRNDEVQRLTEQVATLDQQLELIQLHLKEARDWYKGQFGFEYRKPSPKPEVSIQVSKDKQTEAYTQALARLNR